VRISDIHVDGFGVWSDLSLRSLSREVTVFYGLNEAGKTTLMHFLRSMLYGISADRRGAYLPPLDGGRPGGSLGVDTVDDGPFRIARYAERGPQDTGRVTVELPDGTTQGDRLLRDAIQHVDEPTFNNVFALGLDEIQQLGTLSDSDAAQCIYRLTSGLDRISLYDVIQGLRASRRRIVGGGDTPSKLEQLCAKREKLTSEIADLSGATRKWSQLAVESAELESQIDALRRELKEAERQARHVELAINIRPHWLKRDELRSQLKRFDDLHPLDSDAIDELDAVNERIEEHKRQRDILRGQRHQLRDEAQQLGINEVLCRQNCRLEALGEQQEWLESLAEQAAEFEAEAKQLESQLKAERERLASQWLGDAKRRLELTPAQIEQLAPQQQQLEVAQKQLDEAEALVDSFRSEEDKIRLQLESAMTSSDKLGLPNDLQAAGELVAKLRRRLQVEQKIEQSRRTAIDLEQSAHDALDNQLMPLGLYAASAVSLSVGAASIAAFMTQMVSATSYLQGGGLLLLFGIAVQVHRWWADEQSSDQLDTCHRQIEQIRSQLKQAEEERQRFDADLPIIEGSVVLRLQTAERHLAELEDMLPVETQRRQATEAARTAQRELDAAKGKLASASKAWETQLKALGLPTGLSPQEVRILAGKYEQLAELAERADHRREDVVRRQKEFGRVVGRIRHLAEETHLVLNDASPLEQLEHLLEQNRLQKAHLAHRDKLRERAKKLKADEATHARAAIGLQRQRQARFDKAGVADETAYRRLADDLAEAARIRHDIDDLTRQIAVAAGNGRQESDFADLMLPAVIHTLEATWEKMSADNEALHRTINELSKRRGAIEAQQQSLVADQRLADCQLELGVVEAQIADAEEAWRERAVVSFFLERIRHDYEQNRQPDTLLEASEYFRRLTAGQYTRVWTPLADDVLLVDRPDGTSIGVESLSRGTREQLFLSVRLALVAMFARRGIQLPMILDDVLVNYDERRAGRAAEVLVEFAQQGHQLLVFTCHEHIWRIFKQLDADVRRLPARYASDFDDEPLPATESVKLEAVEPQAVEQPEPVIEAPAALIPEPEADPSLETETPEPIEFEYSSNIPERRFVEFEYLDAIPARPVEPARSETVVEYDWGHDDYVPDWSDDDTSGDEPIGQPLVGERVESARQSSFS
jgi:uncharacterized protein YhaN